MTIKKYLRYKFQKINYYSNNAFSFIFLSIITYNFPFFITNIYKQTNLSIKISINLYIYKFVELYLYLRLCLNSQRIEFCIYIQNIEIYYNYFV